MLKLSVDNAIFVVDSRCRRELLENANAFSSCGDYRGRLFNVLREKRVKGRPRSSDSYEEASGPPAIAKCLQRKSTGKFNIA
ncbi:hypothetical protein FSZ17_17745 [Cytobacillus dafuensis]|uniref:Uncharacterized protein n=1 Tax=Cytobacillus dafuensis TaxID=1742359 RepID=A0A5B8Z7L6_CYTDA|nr:hypothetical protein FSZ17_17745 [Cytobacillus dafuensis]